MLNRESAKKGGGKLARSETVTVRLDPKLRYLAELAARKQRRTLSSFIEWAIEQSLEKVAIQHPKKGERSNLSQLGDTLWDVGPQERFLKLALKAPELLNYKEERMWKFIDEWKALWDVDEKDRRYIRRDLLRSLWNDFEQYGEEEITDEDLEKKVGAYFRSTGLPSESMVIRLQPKYIDGDI
ncbi:hypothetical protein [Nitrosospira sp. Is2]|uniref:hypothetical protein n=1 Tax=Nitrosospira sp. Is2 TaxID=3080532 RepID=UPI00295501E1|nr:hypothetical protein [Nitrosospira sp. Is2]WON75155.1 hypothetical protein R5L00_06665 [Nitrosospira sp. Is2]